jgi:N-acetylmuramoyl-L-alanine amidase
MLSLVVLLLVAFFAIPTSTATGSLTGKKICIDPGHGGSDPGAVNEDFNLQESEINLDVSYGLKSLLEGDGAVVVMTRLDDSGKSNNDRYTFCNSEQATILVSVHTNSTTDPTVDGSLGLYFHKDDKVLAQAIYDIMYPFLRDTAPDPANFTDFGLDRFASGVLLKSEMPAAMMEPLFMSNSAEAELLVQRIYDDPVNGTFSDGCVDFSCRRGQITQALHQGVLNYFSGAEPTPTPEPGGSTHVSAIDMWYEQKGVNYFVYTQVTIHDSNGSPVSGAAVSVITTKPDGLEVSNIDSTGDDGTATFKLRSDQRGAYESTVTDVSREGWVYDETANVETTETLTAP